MTDPIIIISGGPSGLGAAFTLAGKKKVVLIEKGKRVEKRKCPSPDKCLECASCDRMEGMSGVGAFSDGKCIFENIFGSREVGIDYSGIVAEELRKKIERRSLIKTREEMFEHYWGSPIPMPNEEKIRKARQVAITARRNGFDYLFSRAIHIGTDKLPEFMKTIQDDLERKGVEILTQTEMVDFDPEEKIVILSNGKTIKFEHLLIGTGREATIEIAKLYAKHKIPHFFRTIDKGFRIETYAEILQELVDVERDVKLIYRRPNGDLIRTFCVCPNGHVIRETHKKSGFNLVNGHSDPSNPTPYTNFALLMNMPLREANKEIAYADLTARLMFEWSEGSLGLQRLEDFLKDSCTKPKSVTELVPTLKDVKFGDHGGAIPKRYASGLMDVLKRLDVPGLMEGIYRPDTLLYYPEIKLNGVVTQHPYIHGIGDGGGLSRGIGGALASGMWIAERILAER